MVIVKNLQKQFDGFMLKNISFTLDSGYIMGIIGENGAGKTTLLLLLSGLYYPAMGDISVFGMTYQNNEQEIKNEIGFVLADDHLFMDALQLEENASYYGRYYKNYETDILNFYCEKFH